MDLEHDLAIERKAKKAEYSRILRIIRRFEKEFDNPHNFNKDFWTPSEVLYTLKLAIMPRKRKR